MKHSEITTKELLEKINKLISEIEDDKTNGTDDRIIKRNLEKTKTK
tara:strand:+ start:161 stop:298 length:138 start_codon:yes stop_codon:yes gene_type:complete